MPQSKINFPDWKYTISYAHLNFPIRHDKFIWNSCLEVSDCIWTLELPCLKVPCFIWKYPVWKFPISYEIPCLEVPNFKWTYEFPCASLIGTANFHMNFVVWKYLISYQHVNFPDWKLEVPNLIWISTFGSAKFHMNFLDWIAKFHFKRPNFIWNSLFGSAKFHMNFPVWSSKFIRTCQIPWWNYSILCEFPCLEVVNFRRPKEIVKFNLKFPDWKCKISYDFSCLEVPNFI